ncbi:MAG TPA: SRPBCC family protein [Acidimicrobiales bacterium]
MELTGTAVLAAPARRVLPWVADLSTYPMWLSMVTSADPAPRLVGDDGPAWAVGIGARLGPLRRSKRLRMVRTVHAGSRVRFERREVDGREHGAWLLDAALAEEGARATLLTMRLEYRGAAWVGLLEAVLRQEVRRAGPRLDRLVTGERREGETTQE